MKLQIGTKTGLRYFGMADLRSWSPCYDPTRHLPEDFRGTALDILGHLEIPPQDKLWVVLRTSIVSEKLMRLFAVGCARRALTLVGNPDPRSLVACDVAEQFALGKATAEQLSAAQEGAWAARRERHAAYADAGTTTGTTTSTTTSTTTGTTTGTTSASPAGTAADADAAAAYAALADVYAAYAYAAAYASAAAYARTKARREQVAKLREMVVAEGLERVEAKKRRKECKGS